MWRGILMAPQTARRQINKLLVTFMGGQFEAKFKIASHQQRQLADQHDSVFGHITQKTQGFIREPIEHFQKTHQLMALDTAVRHPVEYHDKKPSCLTAPDFRNALRVIRTGLFTPAITRRIRPKLRATALEAQPHTRYPALKPLSFSP